MAASLLTSDAMTASPLGGGTLPPGELSETPAPFPSGLSYLYNYKEIEKYYNYAMRIYD